MEDVLDARQARIVAVVQFELSLAKVFGVGGDVRLPDARQVKIATVGRVEFAQH